MVTNIPTMIDYPRLVINIKLFDRYAGQPSYNKISTYACSRTDREFTYMLPLRMRTVDTHPVKGKTRTIKMCRKRDLINRKLIFYSYRVYVYFLICVISPLPSLLHFNILTIMEQIYGRIFRTTKGNLIFCEFKKRGLFVPTIELCEFIGNKSV